MACIFKVTINDIRYEVDAFDSREFVNDYEKWESELMEIGGTGTAALFHYNQIISAVPITRTLNVKINSSYVKRSVKFHQAIRNGVINFVIFGVWEGDQWKHGIDLRYCDVNFKLLSVQTGTGMISFKPDKTSLDHLLSDI